MILSDIPTDTFNQILADLCADGWKILREYDGIDAWIDYGNIELGKDELRLTFEWDNWFEGIIDGPDAFVEEIKQRYGLKDPA